MDFLYMSFGNKSVGVKPQGGVCANKKINLSTLLWICYAVFAVYATTIPFNAVKSMHELKHNIKIISWTPFYDTSSHGYFSKGDLIANVLFFIPFGFFGWYFFQNKKWNHLSGFIFLSFLGTLLSAFVEFLQMFTIDRNTSDTDLITNTLGTIVGIAFASKIKPLSIRLLYNQYLARFAQSTAAFPLIGITLVTIACALAPFDFTISRDAIIDKIEHVFVHGVGGAFDKKDFVVFLYLGSLVSVLSALCIKAWRVKHVFLATAVYITALAFFIEFFQLFMFSRAPGWGSFFGLSAGILIGLTTQWFASRHYHPYILWILLIFMTLLLLFFNISPPMQNASKLGSFLRFSSKGSQSLAGLGNFIQITSQFIPVGFIINFLCKQKKRLAFMVSLLFIPLLAFPLLMLHHWGLPTLYDCAVLIIAEIAVFIGLSACLWAWPLFNYYCKAYQD